VGAVIVAGLRLDFGDGLGIVLVHPAIDIVEERRIVPQAFGLEEMDGESFADPGHGRAAPAINFAYLLGGRSQYGPQGRLELLIRTIQPGTYRRSVGFDPVTPALTYRGPWPVPHETTQR